MTVPGDIPRGRVSASSFAVVADGARSDKLHGTAGAPGRLHDGQHRSRSGARARAARAARAAARKRDSIDRDPRARTAFGTLAAGDTIQFCRGGAFDMSASGSWVNASCTALKPCTVEDYPPPWGGSARPILWQRDNLANGFDLDHQGHEEGYTFKNLDMRGVGGAGWAFFFHNDLDNVALDNISMDGFNIGVHMSDSAPCPSGAVNCDQSYDHFSLTHLSITNGSNIGYLGTGNDLTIADSLFDNNGDAVVFDHNIYLSSTGGNGIKIRWKKTWATRSKAAGDQRRDRLSDDGGIPQRHHTRKSDSQHGQRVDTPLNHLIVRNNSIYFGTSVTQ